MSQVEFSEVDDDNTLSNVISAGDDSRLFNGNEISNSQSDGENTTVHIYIQFSDGTSISQGIAAVESQALGGESLQVSRRDESGNAVVAILPKDKVSNIKSMEEVAFVKVDTGSNTTTQDTLNSKDSVLETEDANSDSQKEETTEADYNTAEAEQEDARESQFISQGESDSTHQVTTETRENKLDTDINPIFTPIIITALLGLAVLFAILFIKRNK